MVVPEAYGFKSIKWLSHVFLSNIAHANDTYAEKNNDVDSPMKTFWIENKDQPGDDGPYFTNAPWRDADILPPPQQWKDWGWEDQTANSFPSNLLGFASGKPTTWPLRLTQVHWATLHPGLPKGRYTLRCRTIDQQGAAQPMPRPFRKSGHAAIEERDVVHPTP